MQREWVRLVKMKVERDKMGGNKINVSSQDNYLNSHL